MSIKLLILVVPSPQRKGRRRKHENIFLIFPFSHFLIFFQKEVSARCRSKGTDRFLGSPNDLNPRKFVSALVAPKTIETNVLFPVLGACVRVNGRRKERALRDFSREFSKQKKEKGKKEKTIEKRKREAKTGNENGKNAKFAT